MNHSPTEGAQASAKSKTPKFSGAFPVLARHCNADEVVVLKSQFDSVSRQLAQSEERVALLEGELAAILKSYNKAPNGIWFARAFTDSHFYKVGLLLSSSKTN